ncbi:MAG: DUF3108 domain-containing protein [Kofleriaceae bacterium]|nr:DUF3108 domain-containing protein [Kofleriaceae bacterium]
MNPNILVVMIVMTSACLDPPVPRHPLPELISEQSPSSISEFDTLFYPGESMHWDVSWRGIPVGVAELRVSTKKENLQVESKFRSVGFAARVHSIRHHLVTPPQPASGSIDHIHSALGRLRSWVTRAERQGTMRVRYGSQKYSIEFARPVVDHSLGDATLRVKGRTYVHSSHSKSRIDLTLWISDDGRQRPVQILVSQGGSQLRATLRED